MCSFPVSAETHGFSLGCAHISSRNFAAIYSPFFPSVARRVNVKRQWYCMFPDDRTRKVTTQAESETHRGRKSAWWSGSFSELYRACVLELFQILEVSVCIFHFFVSRELFTMTVYCPPRNCTRCACTSWVRFVLRWFWILAGSSTVNASRIQCHNNCWTGNPFTTSARPTKRSTAVCKSSAFASLGYYKCKSSASMFGPTIYHSRSVHYFRSQNLVGPTALSPLVINVSFALHSV